MKEEERKYGYSYHNGRILLKNHIHTLNLITDVYNEIDGAKDYHQLWFYISELINTHKVSFDNKYLIDEIIKDKRVTRQETIVLRVNEFLDTIISKLCNHTTETEKVS